MTAPSSGADRSRRRLVLLRHGQTAWNLQLRGQGQSDIPLDEEGHRQAAAAAAYLSIREPVGLWCSDLSRAVQTCGYLEERTGLSAKQDARLREYDLGEREGMVLGAFAERYPAEHESWESRDDAVLVPGAESTAEVQARMVAALGEILDQIGPGETAIAVSHGAAIQAAVCGLLGWPGEVAAQLRGLDNCAWAAVEQTPERLRLLAWNESVRPGHDAPATL
jgi:probable phosphoglycerate mutase